MNSADSETVNTLQNAILNGLHDGKLDFNSAALSFTDLVAVLDEFLGTHQFIVTDAVVVRETDGLVVSGVATLLKKEKVDVTLIATNEPESDLHLQFKPKSPEHWDLSAFFTASDESPVKYLPLTHSEFTVMCAGDNRWPIRIKITGRLTDLELDGVSIEREWKGSASIVQWNAPESLKFPGIGDVALTDFSFALNLSLSDPTFSGAVNGSIHVGGLLLPLTMVLPSGGEVLQLRGDFQPIPVAGLADITDLLGMDAAAFNVPAIFDKLDKLAISDFEILLNPRSTDIAYISIELQSTAVLPVVPEILELNSIRLGFDLFSPTTAERSLQGTVRGDLLLAGLTVVMRAEIDEMVTLYGHIPTVPLKSLGQSLIPVESIWDSLPDDALEEVFISLNSGGDFEVNSESANLELTAIADKLGIPLPDGISDITLNRFSISRTAEDGLSRVDIASDTEFLFDSTDEAGLRILDVSIGMEHQVASGAGSNCSFRLDGAVIVSPELSLLFQDLIFSWDQVDKRWSVEGTAIASILGTEYTLEVAVEVQGDRRTISLHYPWDLPLTDLGGAGSVIVHNLALRSTKTGEGSEKSTRWELSGGARMSIDHLLETEGKLSLQTGSEGSRLELSAKAPKLPPISLPLGFPSDPELQLLLDELTIAYEKSADGKAGWSFISAAHLQIVDIPDLLEKYLPSEPLHGRFFADGKTVGIGFDVPSTLQPEFPELALTFANDFKLSLGRPGISVKAIELQLGEQPRLVEKIRVSLPAELNNLFGVDHNNKPNIDLFNDEFELQLVMAKRLGLNIVTSPFKPLKFDTIDGDDGQWTKWNFGTVGIVEFRVPEFSFQGGSWKASCGFNRLTEIGLPLKPIRFLLEKCGFPRELLKAIPDALPLRDLDLTGDNFSREMKLLLGNDVLGRLDSKSSAVLNELFDAIKKMVDRLPTRLQDYLQIRIPKSAIMEISIDSTGGGTSIALRTLADDPPLKFLFPLMIGVPELVGMSLRGLSFGQKMGGALALIEVDGQIDRFDMLSLIGALALNKQDISNRYILEKTLFVLPTAFPVPIPLFFTDIGLDYRDVLGFDIQAHWSYPDPQLDVFKTISLFSELIKFFKEPSYLLHNEGFGETLGLKLTIGKNFITLPSYLGGKTLGLQQPLPTLSAGDSVARFLDFLKTGNAGYAINAIPLQHEGVWIRIGSEEIRFGPLAIGMSWCITTDQEFVNKIIPASHQNDNLPVAFDNAVLESLPTNNSGKSSEKGFIILLMGYAEIGSIVGMRTEFGIAVTAQGGFETGFRIFGEIGGALALRISGAVQADEKSVIIRGSTGIFWHDQPLIASSGQITVSDEALEVIITIKLGATFSLTGLFVVGNQGLLLDGEAVWGHGADGPSEGLGASVQFDRDGMIIVFDWCLAGLDGEVRIQVPGDTNNSLFTATVALKPNMAMQEAFARDIKAVAQSAAEETVDRVYHDLQNAIGAVDSLELSIAGLRNWLPKLCDEIIAVINKNIDANTNGWKRPGRASARKQARPYINRLITLRDITKNASDKTIRPKLKAALQDIIDNNILNVTVGIPSVRWKKKGWIRYPVHYTRRVSIYTRKLMDASQLPQLQQGIDWIDKLPGANGVRVDTQKIYDQLPDRDKLLGEIYRDINNGVDKAVPQIESIGFATSLGVLDIGGIEATVIYRRGGNDYHETITLDFSNPAKITQQLVGAFGSG